MFLFQNDVFVFSKTNVKMKIPAKSSAFAHQPISWSKSRAQGQGHSLSWRKKHAEIITTPVLNSGLIVIITRFNIK